MDLADRGCMYWIRNTLVAFATKSTWLLRSEGSAIGLAVLQPKSMAKEQGVGISSVRLHLVLQLHFYTINYSLFTKMSDLSYWLLYRMSYDLKGIRKEGLRYSRNDIPVFHS